MSNNKNINNYLKMLVLSHNNCQLIAKNIAHLFICIYSRLYQRVGKRCDLIKQLYSIVTMNKKFSNTSYGIKKFVLLIFD
jgi:hypothetical protein